MSSLHELKINNDKSKAIKTGSWSNPGAKFYDELLNSFYCDGGVPTDSTEIDKTNPCLQLYQMNPNLK